MTKNKKWLQRFGFTHHEYWPWWVLLVPIWFRWVWYMFKLRKLTWFTAVNPGMEDSGFMGESKIRILESIPKAYLPTTQFVKFPTPFSSISYQVHFPCIAKPDIGGRGRKVVILNSKQEHEQYHQHIEEDYMLQNIITYPEEYGVFYVRMPWEFSGRVVSLSHKEFLSVTGDGKKTIKQLMLETYRAKKQISRLEKSIDMQEILPSGVQKILEPIGNHCRGTIFRSKQHLLCSHLDASIDRLAKQIPGFYYGRFDLRVPTFEHLLHGENIAILELNGLTSDPSHIFDPDAKLLDAISTLWTHCAWCYKIARYNLKKNVPTTPVLILYKKLRKSFA